MKETFKRRKPFEENLSGKCMDCGKSCYKQSMKTVSTGNFCCNNCAFKSLKRTALSILKEMERIAPKNYELIQKFEIKEKFISLLDK